MRRCVVLLAGCLLAADWPQHLGPQRDGVAGGENFTLNPAPAVLWKHDVGPGWAAPIVQGEQLVIFHRQKNDEVIDCLNALTGKPLWTSRYRTRYVDSFGFDEGPRATPVIADGRIFTLGAAGELTATRLTDGKQLWQRPLKTDYAAPQGYFGIASSPIVVGEKLIVNVGAKGASVVAFDVATGKEIWKSGNDAASYSSPTLVTLGKQSRVLFYTRTGLLGIDPESGKILFSETWRPRIDASVNAATPLAWNDQIFISTSYQRGGILFQVKDDSLTTIWSNDDVMSNHYNTAILAEGKLFGIHGRQEERPDLHCADWATGKLLWSQKRFGCAGLICMGSTIFAQAENGDFVAFAVDVKAYRELARVSVLQSPVRALPALANGIWYARDGDQLIALDLRKK